jgi:6-phosphogluconolactonase (cycloisomerase 2 family)
MSMTMWLPKFPLYLALVSPLLLPACGGGGGGGGTITSTATAPSNLFYPTGVQLYLLSLPANELTPSYDGSASTFSISPALPAGLTLDPATGVLSGMPTEVASRRLYLVTATNESGNVSTSLDMSVSQPPRRLLLGGTGVNEVATMLVDAPTGNLRHHTWAQTGSAPCDQIIAHPRLPIFYELSNANDTVEAFLMEASSATALSLGLINLQPGPHKMAMHPDGLAVYVSAESSGFVQAIGLSNAGAPGLLGPPLNVGVRPLALAVQAEGNFLVVGNQGTAAQAFPSDATLETIPLDGAGAMMPFTTSQVTNGAVPIALAAQGNRVYFAPSNFSFVLGFDIEPSTGVLTAITPGVATSFIPTDLALSPGGPYLIAVLGNDVHIQRFALDPNTGLAEVSGPAIDLGTSPAAATYDQSGRYLYVSLPNFEAILVQRVDPDSGILTPVGAFRSRGTATSMTVLSGPEAIVTSLHGLYSLDEGEGELRAFQIDPSDGGLDPITGPLPLPGPFQDPVAVAVDPLGEFVFAVSKIDRFLWSIPILADGSMGTPPAPIAPMNDPIDVVVDSSGRFVYAAGELFGQIAMYDLDRLTGELALRSQVTLGGSPSVLAVDPTGRYLVVGDEDAQTLTLIPINNSVLNGAVHAFNLVAGPTSLNFTRDGAFVIISLGATDQVQVVRIDTLLEVFAANGVPNDLPLGASPVDAVRSPIGNFVFAAASGTGEVVVMDAPNSGTLIPRIPNIVIGSSVSDILITPDGRRMYALDPLGQGIVPIQVAENGDLTVLGSVPAGLSPTEAVIALRYQ